MIALHNTIFKPVIPCAPRWLTVRHGVALNHLGRVALRQQNFAHAQELYAQSRTICAEINDRGGLATALEGLGVAATALGEFERARQHFYEALKLAMRGMAPTQRRPSASSMPCAARLIRRSPWLSNPINAICTMGIVSTYSLPTTFSVASS